jgi:hypothetical protein
MILGTSRAVRVYEAAPSARKTESTERGAPCAPDAGLTPLSASPAPLFDNGKFSRWTGSISRSIHPSDGMHIGVAVVARLAHDLP